MQQNAPTLFNLYTYVVGERWLSRVAEMEAVGSYLRYKFDQQLFRRYTRNASEDTIKEYQFADDVALLATTGKELKQHQSLLLCREFFGTYSEHYQDQVHSCRL